LHAEDRPLIEEFLTRIDSEDLQRSEPLDPRPELYLPGPGAARLSQDVQIGLRNGIGVEHRVGLVRSLGSARIADPAVDHEMRDVNALRREFARHALRQSTKRELAHREG